MYCPLAESRSDASTDGEPDKDEQIREKLLALDKSSLVPYEFIRTPAQPHGVLYHAYYNSQLSLRQVLLNFNDPLSPGIVLLWMFQIFSTLEYLHQRQLNHGHLSLDTVLVVPSSTGTGTTSPTSGNSSGCIQLIEYARHHDQVLEPERIYDDYHALKRIWKKLHQHMSNTKTAKEIELKGHYQAELDQFDTTLRRICRTMAKHVENPKPNLLEKFELVRKNLVSQCWPAFEQTHASWIETQHKRDLHHQRQEVMDEIRLWHQTFESQMQRKPTETEKKSCHQRNVGTDEND